MLLAILAAVVVVTRMSLDLHAETVDLLRLMGAADRYVGAPVRATRAGNGLRGGIAGFGTGLLLVVAFILIGTGVPGLGLRACRCAPPTGCCSPACRCWGRC